MVSIERYTSISNGIGGWTEEWVPHIEQYEYMAIDMLSGDEVLAADKLGRKSSHILIGTIADIKAGDRVLFKEEYYRVTYVDNPMNMDVHLEINLDYVGEWHE